ncbi:MAG: hypothetical protein WCH43_07895 [Verrucomicrobiota bacterium]
MIMFFIIVGMILLPGLLVYTAMGLQQFTHASIEPGDVIVYRKQKASTHPGTRAYAIHASAGGDIYSYFVDKYWTVADISGNGQIVAVTRTQKHHFIPLDDPNLRKARLTERLRHSRRWPQLAV